MGYGVWGWFDYCDTNFPSDSVAKQTMYGKVLRINASTAQAVRAVLSVYPINSFVDDAVACMEVVGEPDTILLVMEEVQAEVKSLVGPDEN
ncbi:MAG: hypothetical protein P8I83_08315 [Paracoccaceae bacterium]|jgi:L-fucose mutarotase|nr:hypothetical protein [Paracoccaceae bacterium]